MKFISNIQNIIFESNEHSINPQIIDEIEAIADTIKDNVNKEVRVPKDVLDSFKIKKTLNPNIWSDDTIDSRIKFKLIKIAKDFFKELEIPNNVKIKDIIFTGSLANFNWSKFSDIDLHIVLDFKELDTDSKFTEDYFKSKKTIWNQEHDITVFDYPVELYVQDINQKLIATAVYSVLNDKWLKKPSREEFKLDKKIVLTKANDFIGQLRDIRQDYNDKKYQSVIDKVTRIKKKIKDMRTAGLEKGGEFSIENIVFKTLRRTPFMDILDSFKAKSYDKLMSVSETISEESKINTKGGVLFIKGAELDNGEQRLFVTTINNLLTLDRKKIDDSTGEPVKMAILGNQVYRVIIKDDKLKAVGVDWKSQQILLKSIGLKRNGVALNDNKTPEHWKSLEHNNIARAISSMNFELLNIPSIRWVG